MIHDSSPSDEWQRGDVISKEFKVVRRLGRGGMASVYLVRNVDVGHHAAVKVPLGKLMECRETRTIFSREVQTWIALPKHPHLIQCFFLRECQGLPIVFAEYVSSGSLEGWIQKKRIRGLHHFLDLSIQIAEAMRVAEAHGIVHRDLKPSNCLLDSAGKIKVGDFGLAASWEHIAEQQTQAGHRQDNLWRFSAGTQSYCSPEQFEGAPVDITTDIWSFAVTLYEMISARRPGLGPAAPHAVKQYCTLAASQSTPRDIWAFLLDMMATDRAKRPQSFAAVSERLRELFRKVTGHGYERQFPTVDLSGNPNDSPTSSPPSNPFGQTTPDPIDRRRKTASVLKDLAQQQEFARSIQDDSDRDPKEHHDLYRSLLGIATSHRQLGNLSEAISAYSDCVHHLQERFHEQPTDDIAGKLVGAFHDRAVCRRQSGDTAGAVGDYDDCLSIFKYPDRQRRGHPFLNLLASIYQNRAMALLKGMRLENALSDATTAIEIREPLVRKEGCIQYAIDLAGTLINRAVIYRNLGDPARTLADYTAAQQICTLPDAGGQFTTKSEVLPFVYLNRAALYLSGGNASDAKRDCDEAIRIFEAQWVATKETAARLNLSNALNNRANANRLLGRSAQAIEDITRCREIRLELVEQDGLTNVIPPLARAFSNEALFQLDAGKSFDALATLNRGVPILRSVVQRMDQQDIKIDLAKMLLLRGTALTSCGQLKNATEDLNAACDLYGHMLHSGSIEVVAGMLAALLAQTQVGIEWVDQDRRANAKQSTAPDSAECEVVLQNICSHLNRLGETPNLSGAADELRVGLGQLRQSIESLQRRSTTRAGASALAAIDRISRGTAG